MNQLLHGHNNNNNNNEGEQDEPGNIEITVIAGHYEFKLQIEKNTPFNLLVETIKQKVFAQEMQKQFNDKINYKIEGYQEIYKETEQRKICELGLKQGSRLYALLQLKGGASLILTK